MRKAFLCHHENHISYLCHSFHAWIPTRPEAYMCCDKYVYCPVKYGHGLLCFMQGLYEFWYTWYIYSYNLFLITMTSWWARWRLKSPASRLFTQPGNSPHKWPVTRKMFSFDDIIILTGSVALRHSFDYPAGWRWSNPEGYRWNKS